MRINNFALQILKPFLVNITQCFEESEPSSPLTLTSGRLYHALGFGLFREPSQILTIQKHHSTRSCTRPLRPYEGGHSKWKTPSPIRDWSSSSINRPMKKILDLVITFVKRGWPMLPCCARRKSPCVPWKAFQRRNPTDEEIREWDRKFRPTGWGVVTGRLAGIVVADFDGDDGTNLLGKWGLVPHVRTGSGGFHVYFQHPGWDVPTLNARSGKGSWPWPGLDIRGDGGFAMLLGRNDKGPYVHLRELVPEDSNLCQRSCETSCETIPKARRHE